MSDEVKPFVKADHVEIHCAAGCGRLIAYGNHKGKHFCEFCGHDPIKNPPAKAKKSQMLENLESIEKRIKDGANVSDALTDLIASMKASL